ncbi:citrate lyase holo-ACP synthase [Streptococcus bovimastitidis]|uniref:citrate lyase holo-[acyl-carrier protein] synthase n=1 Tax=Streptococcus bovimastitidis TaxID=1856638 RepID=A0A1L8MLV7_9STRE|nr:citrate lyase holo-[acyl-carrier protein] synthase [Streptococcus bovimastitidis]OJF71665.1 citrate lyase holo-ACP synthase [Streptococcus bovimastitidis]
MSKTSIFTGENVSLEEMMAAREQRSFRQLSLFKKYPDTNLLSVTMNIPGAIKTSPKLKQVFEEMVDQIEVSLADQEILFKHYLPLKTGSEYYLLTTLSAQDLKKRMINLETENSLGRLFDLDVLWLNRGKMEAISRQDLGLAARKCYVCADNAKSCGRSRKHSVEEMQAVISQIITSNKEKEEE